MSNSQDPNSSLNNHENPTPLTSNGLQGNAPPHLGLNNHEIEQAKLDLESHLAKARNFSKENKFEDAITILEDLVKKAYFPF